MFVNAVLFPPISEIYELDESGNPKIMEGDVWRWLLNSKVHHPHSSDGETENTMPAWTNDGVWS